MIKLWMLIGIYNNQCIMKVNKINNYFLCNKFLSFWFLLHMTSIIKPTKDNGRPELKNISSPPEYIFQEERKNNPSSSYVILFSGNYFVLKQDFCGGIRMEYLCKWQWRSKLLRAPRKVKRRGPGCKVDL